MAKWCFKHFINILDACKKNEHGIPKTQIVMDLLDFIAFNHMKTHRCKDFIRITEETRARKFYGEKPTPIPVRYYRAVEHRDFGEEEILNDFKQFIKHFHSELLVNRVLTLIRSDIHLPKDDQQDLIEASTMPCENFILYAFIDVIRFRGNGEAVANDDDFFSLDEQIENISDNEKLLELFKEALAIENFELVRKSLKKLTNHIYISRSLLYLSCEPLFSEVSDYRKLFHDQLSSMTNNRYREQLMTACLTTGYFGKKRHELYSHFNEFSNNRYLYNTLLYMWKELNLKEEVYTYQKYFTSSLYKKMMLDITNSTD